MEDNNKINERKKRKIILVIVIAICIAAALLFRPIQIIITYNQALELLDNDEYELALTKLETIKHSNFLDTFSLICLCKADKYKNKNIYDAKMLINEIDFRFQTEERLEKFNDYIDRFNKEYEEYRESFYDRLFENKRYYYSPAPSKSTTKHHYSSRPSTGYSDGPSMEGFYDPEDFYDEYYDDFYDYEDAEDYYYEHAD